MIKVSRSTGVPPKLLIVAQQFYQSERRWRHLSKSHIRLKSLSYNRWRTYDPEDSLRFFGVRMYEAGMIKTNPQKLIAQGTDWRFVNQLKKELKA